MSSSQEVTKCVLKKLKLTLDGRVVVSFFLAIGQTLPETVFSVIL